MTNERPYEPPTVTDLGTLEDLTGTFFPGSGMNETGLHGSDKTLP